MNCYNHPHVEAVGVCSVCGRGVCRSCQVIMEGHRYCKDHAEKRVEVEERVIGLHRRGWALSVGSILAITHGLAEIVVGFLLMILGMFNTPNQPSILTSTVGPFLNYFEAVLQFPPIQTIVVGFVLSILGILNLVAGYYLWRRSRAGAILAVVDGIVGGAVLGAYLVIFALAGSFTFISVATAAVEIGAIGYGWNHLKHAVKPARKSAGAAQQGRSKKGSVPGEGFDPSARES